MPWAVIKCDLINFFVFSLQKILGWKQIFITFIVKINLAKSFLFIKIKLRNSSLNKNTLVKSIFQTMKSDLNLKA